MEERKRLVISPDSKYFPLFLKVIHQFTDVPVIKIKTNDDQQFEFVFEHDGEQTGIDVYKLIISS